MCSFVAVSPCQYRSCEEGCCIHEYCAYHRICYPKIHCRFGCPDGSCVGEEEKTSTKYQPGRASMKTPTKSKGRIGLSSPVNGRANRDRASALFQNEARAAPRTIPNVGERYFNQNNEIISRAGDAAGFARSSGAHNQILAHASVSQDMPTEGATRLGAQNQEEPAQSRSSHSIPQDIAKDMPGNSGICMPTPPCKVGEACGMGNVCTFNYNLGYPTCQYNLEIGSTLCYDKNGQLNLQVPS